MYIYIVSSYAYIIYILYILCVCMHNKTEIGRICSTYGERRGAYRALVGKPEGWRPLGRPRRRWENNIKMDLREVGWGRRLD
jgi:hypothetical protein